VQTQCPHCQQRIGIDDAKVPDRPFSIKCPKCQTVVKLPGKGAAVAPTPVAEPEDDATLPPTPVPVPAAPPPALAPPAPPMHFPAASPQGMAPVGVADEMRVQLLAQLRREMALGENVTSMGRALVGLPDRSQSGAVTLALTRQGFTVDALEDWEEAGRLLDQSLFNLVVTSRPTAAGAKTESLYQRVTRLSPDARRRIFLILIGDDLKTGDANQAFTLQADLALHSRDAATFDSLLRSTLAERTRLYQAYLDARRRHDQAGSV
jgi:predicted Zn finger-like uncharacterized protein